MADGRWPLPSTLFGAAPASIWWARIDFDGATAASTAFDAWAFGGVSDYPLTAAAGSYSLTGVDAALKATRTVGAVVGSYTLTGVVSSQQLARNIAAARGTFALDGMVLGLSLGPVMTASAGSYAQTGVAATITRLARLSSAVGAYTLTGISATFGETQAVTVGQGGEPLFSTILAAMDASVFYRRVDESGEDDAATVWQNWVFGQAGILFTAEAGFYDISGVAQDLDYDPNIRDVGPGGEPIFSVLTTGRDAAVYWPSIDQSPGEDAATVWNRWVFGVLSGYTLDAELGEYTTTGVVAGLTPSNPPGDVSMAAVTGTYNIVGASSISDIMAVAALGTFTLSGLNNNLTAVVSNRLIAATGSYALNGVASNVAYNRKAAAATGAFALTGVAAASLRAYAVAAVRGVYALAGQDATLSAASVTNFTVTIESGTFTYSGVSVPLRPAYKGVLDAGAIVLTGQDTTSTPGRRIALESGSIAVTGATANLSRYQAGVLALEGTFVVTATLIGTV
jgi:hypothetical protein